LNYLYYYPKTLTMPLFGDSKEEKTLIEIVKTQAETIAELVGKSVQKIKPVLVFNFFYKTQNCNFMSVVSSLTLTSTAPVTLSMTVVDQTSGNVIAGVLSGLSYAPADPTQDIAVVDPSNPLEVDVHAVLPTGGTSVVATGNFVSTLLGTDGVTPVFSGSVTGTLVLVNNVPVAVLNPVLAFNQ
jgi:hypothetical protein